MRPVGDGLIKPVKFFDLGSKGTPMAKVEVPEKKSEFADP